MVFSYASPSRSRPGDDERLRGDHWRPPPRRRVRGAGPADPRRSPAVPLRRKRSMRRVRMCSQSPARVEAAVPAVGPRVGGPRASPRAPLPAASRAGATPSRARPRRTRGASFPKALSALSRGARERRTRSRNHGPGTEHGRRPKRPTSCPSSRGSRRCPRSRGSPGESFCLRAASASRRRARRSHLAGSSLVAPSRLCRTGSPPNERKPPEARLRRRACAHFRRGGRRPVPRARRRSRADAAEDLRPDHFFASEAASAALRPRPRRRRETRARPGRPRAASHAPPDPRRALCSPYFFEKVSVKNNSSPPPRSSAARTGGPRTRGGALLTPSSEAPPRRARRAARRPARFRPKLRLNAPRRARRPARRWRRAARR